MASEDVSQGRERRLPTPKELGKTPEDYLKLASETKEIYAKIALVESSTEFRAVAEYLERDA